MKRKRLQYKGPSRDLPGGNWMRLVHGRHYEVEVKEMSSGKVRTRVFEPGYEDNGVSVGYATKREFDKEWC